ncbi:MAG TPA: HAD family hydrolase [Candidatus Nanoarchaeia archaeon]|nr:HAD family hydrolase [Candidatus Nanoarchaeia archaeon]
MPKPIEAIILDLDGTLIEGGTLNKFHPHLKTLIRNARKEGILFTLSSGRCFPEQFVYFTRLIAPDKPCQKEAILYEESALRLFDEQGEIGQPVVLGGLTPEQRQEINAFAYEHNLYDSLVSQASSESYQHMIGYVTPTFISEGRTNSDLLKRKHLQIKEALERRFQFVEVTRSADAVDIKSKGVSKAKQVQLYSELTGIPLEQMAYFGDSGNDLPAISKIGLAGGYVVYVGKDTEEEREVRQLPNYFIPEQKGPLGTVIGIENILWFNQKVKTE